MVSMNRMHFHAFIHFKDKLNNESNPALLDKFLIVDL